MKYIAICYHYIRPQKDPIFPKTTGNKVSAFREQIQMLKKTYSVISPDDAYKISLGQSPEGNREYGLLITLDDALSDHYGAASILADHGIKAFFFINTCVLQEKLPANPTIIHYCLAHCGIKRFASAYTNALEECNISPEKYAILFKGIKGNPQKIISDIKNTFKYKLPYEDSRNILLYMYENLFLKDFPDALEIMHLTEKQVRDIVGMGHSLGAHTNSHISIGATKLTGTETKKELIEPKEYLEKTFKTPVNALAYPFGARKDCLSGKELLKKTDGYALAFSIQSIVNTENLHPLELGRYSIKGSANEAQLKKALEEIKSETS